LGLHEHLLLLSCDTLSLSFFLLADESFALGDLRLATITAPPLTLPRTEVVGPGMTVLAFDLDYCYDGGTVLRNNRYLTLMTLSLSSNGIDDFHTVMADLIHFICELPECMLTATAG